MSILFRLSFFCSALLWFAAFPASAIKPEAKEMEIARRWVEENFRPAPSAKLQQPDRSGKSRLKILANYGPVLKYPKPLKIGDTEYSHALFSHVPGRIIIGLPGPAKTFTATVGLDRNDNDGPAVFSVHVSGKELFRSDAMRHGRPGVPVNVDLGGATEVTLEISEAGDIIRFGHACWADPKITLMDGQEISLDELPITEADVPERRTFKPPFSFRYGNMYSDELLGSWKFASTTRKLDANRRERTMSYSDPKTGLVVRCVLVEYLDYPTVEWTLYLHNTGANDTPILSHIQAFDTRIERDLAGEFLLHYASGDGLLHRPDGEGVEFAAYQPHQLALGPGDEKRFSSLGGRPTNGQFPYFNIEWGGGGIISVIAWPGQWAAYFLRDQETGLRICGGQELTHFKLHPGEEVRTPMVVLQFYKGDWLRAQNIWRRWMVAHNMPRPGGKQIRPQLAASSAAQYHEMNEATEENQKMFIDRYIEEDLKPDYWWMDCGWWSGGCVRAGTWEVDEVRFPKGLRAVSDRAHSKDVKIIVWFEPEHVWRGTRLHERHPEWLLGPDREERLLDLSNLEVQRWLEDYFATFLDKQGVDVYRQDFNIEPLLFWRANDAEDRQGITEIRYVTAYLSYWDELLRRRPGLMIDTCASGGRRIDLETLRRSIPLHRSDYTIFSGEPIGQQVLTYGLAFWIPFFGTPVNRLDTYGFRSCMCPWITFCYDMREKNQDYGHIRSMYQQWRQIAADYLGDYYPLTGYSAEKSVWMAWQFDRPEASEGIVQAFRRPGNPDKTMIFKLHSLDGGAKYIVHDLDSTNSHQMTGQELMKQGLSVTIPEQPGAAVVKYKKIH